MIHNNKVEPNNQCHLSQHTSYHPKIQVNNNKNKLIKWKFREQPGIWTELSRECSTFWNSMKQRWGDEVPIPILESYFLCVLLSQPLIYPEIRDEQKDLYLILS